MKVGTKSLIFGVHQFAWHPLMVALAWHRLYREWPSWRVAICIVIHDFGYWGCADMDGDEGVHHPVRGMKIAGKLFGHDYADLVLFHSRTMADRWGREPSKLCWPDKLSLASEPRWFYLFRAHLSGEIHEYRLKAHRWLPSHKHDTEWFDFLKARFIDIANKQRSEPMTNDNSWRI